MLCYVRRWKFSKEYSVLCNEELEVNLISKDLVMLYEDLKTSMSLMTADTDALVLLRILFIILQTFVFKHGLANICPFLSLKPH